MSRSRRPGAALVMALLLLVVLDCIVLGTLHLSLQEHRIGANGAAALRLRLEAGSAVRRALAHWSAGFDTMPVGGPHRLPVAAAASAHAQVHIERLGEDLYLIDALAAEALPRAGRAGARLLVLPPALPSALDPAAAPLSAAGSVRIGATGVISGASPATCAAATAAHSTLTRLLSDVVADPGARIDAPAGLLGPHDLIAQLDRVAALAEARDPALVSTADTTLTGTGAGVTITRGSLTLASGAVFAGLILSLGTVVLEEGAAVRGAIHAGADVTVQGTISGDPCAVAAALAGTGLDRAVPAGARAWLPAF